MKDLSDTIEKSDDRLRVFLSYSRDDLDFVNQLEAVLTFLDYDVIIDRHGIAPGEDWQTRLGTMISEADTIVFVLTPTSAASKVCAWEVDEAVRLGKRIIPVLCRPLEGATPHEELSDLNYIFFYDEPRSSPGSGFGTGQVKLVSALNTDLAWLREHTRLLQRATEWDNDNRPDYRLLSGGDITEAKDWVARHPKDAPDPTALQLDFIRASEAAEENRHHTERRRLEEMAAAQAERAQALEEREIAQKREAEQSRRVVRRTFAGLVAALVLAAVAGGAGILAWDRQKEAVEQRQTAEEQREAAVAATKVSEEQRDRANQALARVFAERSWTVAAQERPEDLADEYDNLAMRYALAGSQIAPDYDAGNRAALAYVLNRRSAYHSRKIDLFTGGKIIDLAAVPGTSHLFVVDKGGQLAVIDLESGAWLWEDKYPSGTASSVTVSADGRRAAVVGHDRSVWLLDLAERTEIAKIPGGEVQHYVPEAFFSPDGTRLIAPGIGSGPERLLDGQTGDEIRIEGEKFLKAITFSPDSALLFVEAYYEGPWILDGKTGKRLGKLPDEHDDLSAVAFSADGQRMFTHAEKGIDPGVIAVWERSDAGEYTLAKSLKSYTPVDVYSLQVSPDGSKLFARTDSGVVVVDWLQDQILASTLTDRTNVGSGVLTADGAYAAINGFEDRSKIWIWDSKIPRVVMTLEVELDPLLHSMVWAADRLVVSNATGSLRTFDLSGLAMPIEDAVAIACSESRLGMVDELSKSRGYSVPDERRFRATDIANDPLIREAWDPKGNARSVCE